MPGFTLTNQCLYAIICEMIHEIGHCLNFTKINLMTGWGGGDFCFPLAGNVVFLSLISILC